MDLDVLRESRQGGWDRLDALARRRIASGEAADELIERYRAGAADLATIAGQSAASPLGERLSVSLARARLRFTGAGPDLFSRVPTFFVRQLPAALYRLRWLTAVIAAATALIAAAFALWANVDPRVMAAIGDPAQLKDLAENAFTGYYSQSPAAAFAGQVWTNNALIAALCIVCGITGVYPPYVIVQNAMNIGVDGAVLFSYGRGGVFFQYIAPHGMLELTSVFVAAAAGLRIFWAWVAPGARSRAQALAEDGRALVTVSVGLTLSLLVSGLIEGFVTPSALPWPVKVGIGALALAAFLCYMLVLGRRAAEAGDTGDVAEFDAGARRLVAG
ncbi:MAG TPA: stage II sporulation protein M [Microbacteriaceae bacterium]|nr:stage II sporulation protein M [Microbacteriaceae bacterium]